MTEKNMLNQIKKLLEASNAHPFLFVGSGFTHRYLKTDDWRELINHFAKKARPETGFAFEFYRNEVSVEGIEDVDLPAISELVEKDFTRRFLSESEFSTLRNRYTEQIHQSVSPLKIGVSDHLISSESKFEKPEYPDEISALGHARKNIAGIITTNFDRYLEQLFPDNLVYVGQNELLFNQSYGVGEIYKIHGCVSRPGSLVLTTSDYAAYRSQNAYLSAKLMTIFLEHPIIFIGYSLQDSNIRLIFKDIANCLNEEQLGTLSDRLIFIQREKKGRPRGINTVREHFDKKSIVFKQVVLPEFATLYKAIAGLRTSYPPKLLRKLKKDIYELVLSTAPKERIKVMDIDETTDFEKVEYVMGVGISKHLSGIGYSGLNVPDLIEDLIYDRDELDATQVVELVLPKLGKQNSHNLPIFKYLSKAKPTHIDDRLAQYIADVKIKGIDKWISNSMRNSHKDKSVVSSINELRQKYDFSDLTKLHYALTELPFIRVDQIDLEAFRQLLVELYETHSPLVNNNLKSLPTNFRRAVRIYDWLRYGHKKTL